MKRFILFILLFCLSEMTFATEELYIFDPTHTAVVWHINHFGFSSPSGKWMADGTLDLDREKLDKSKVKITIALENMQTGVERLDEHLRTADFFDVKKYPVATFESTKVQVTGEDAAKVYGNLKLHGVTKEVVLDVKLNKQGVHPITNKKSVGFTATTMLKRSDFGMNKYAPGLGDEVKIDIEAEASTNS